MKPTRRSLLKSTAGMGMLMPLSGGVPHFLLQTGGVSEAQGMERSKEDQVLVVLQLSGGNDGLNTVVPYGHDPYRASRSTLRLEAR